MSSPAASWLKAWQIGPGSQCSGGVCSLINRWASYRWTTSKLCFRQRLQRLQSGNTRLQYTVITHSIVERCINCGRCHYKGSRGLYILRATGTMAGRQVQVGNTPELRHSDAFKGWASAPVTAQLPVIPSSAVKGISEIFQRIYISCSFINSFP